MNGPIHIDLVRDLPKVRKQYAKLLNHLGACNYTAPCVVGAMVPPKVRRALEGIRIDGSGSVPIDALIETGRVVVPEGQRNDFLALQEAFDFGEVLGFERTLKDIESRYLTETVSA